MAAWGGLVRARAAHRQNIRKHERSGAIRSPVSRNRAERLQKYPRFANDNGFSKLRRSRVHGPSSLEG